jgi:cytochrome b561
MVRIAMLVSIVLYVYVGETVAGKNLRTPAPNPPFYFAITLVGIAIVGMIFALRRLFVLRAEQELAARPEDPAALMRWRSGYIITYAMSEAIALLGLVLRLIGSSLSQAAPFYFVAFILMLFFGPRRPSSEIG